jgi:hypothetical protein
MHSIETRRKIGDALFKGVYFDCLYCSIRCRISQSKFNRKIKHFCSTNCYAKYREDFMKPEEQPTWRGGITRKTQQGRGSKKYVAWQQAVLIRDNKTCVWCRATDKLEADHIKRWAYYPELRYELSNGRTLCQTCHNKTRNKSFYENPELLK